MRPRTVGICAAQTHDMQLHPGHLTDYSRRRLTKCQTQLPQQELEIDFLPSARARDALVRDKRPIKVKVDNANHGAGPLRDYRIISVFLAPVMIMLLVSRLSKVWVCFLPFTFTPCLSWRDRFLALRQGRLVTIDTPHLLGTASQEGRGPQLPDSLLLLLYYIGRSSAACRGRSGHPDGRIPWLGLLWDWKV